MKSHSFPTISLLTTQLELITSRVPKRRGWLSAVISHVEVSPFARCNTAPQIMVAHFNSYVRIISLALLCPTILLKWPLGNDMAPSRSVSNRKTQIYTSSLIFYANQNTLWVSRHRTGTADRIRPAVSTALFHRFPSSFWQQIATRRSRTSRPSI